MSSVWINDLSERMLNPGNGGASAFVKSGEVACQLSHGRVWCLLAI